MVFTNREQAGELLAEKLSDYAGRDDVIVLAIPRGGVVVGAEIAKKLGVPLEVLVTKKIGAPLNPELAVGAAAEDGEPIFDKDLIARLGIKENELRKTRNEVYKKIKGYIKKFRKGRELKLEGKTVIVTDDGVATGSTVEAALAWIRAKSREQGVKKRSTKMIRAGPKQVVLAIPTGARDSMERLEKLADESICLEKPRWFTAVGQFYQEFDQVSDEQVLEYLKKVNGD